MAGPTGEHAGGGEQERTPVSSQGASSAQAVVSPALGAVIALQRSVGNRAVAAVLQRQPPPPAAPPSAADLNTRFQQQMSRTPTPDYDGAALTLNGFSDTDLDAMVSSVPSTHRLGLFIGAMNTMLLWPPPHRVAIAIQRADPTAARDGRIEYIRQATGRSEWRQVALALNGFSDADIDYVVESVLPAAALEPIRTAAQTHMAGWNDRVVRGLNRIIVANAMGTMADPAAPTRAIWRPSGNNPGRTSFSAWAMAATEDRTYTIDPTKSINCWEMVLYSAYKSGSLSWRWIHDMYTYTGPNDWYDELAARIGRNARTWNRVTKAPRPRRGEIVLFDGASHVALATGVVDAAGSHIYSFWPPPDVSFLAGGTPDRVKDITIESLLPACDQLARQDGRPACVVTIGTPAW